ncbi:hypothetical protein IQ07DRAFT_562817 [Pyrenochaeta sp. DS3sAY3a]|nr:hypothetical protein IQ07DRAFT_562817 [Pyrenochaeta sp. DS3sAY3a]
MSSALLSSRPIARAGLCCLHAPVLDFLAPCTASAASRQRLRFHTSRPRRSTPPPETPITPQPSHPSSNGPSKPVRPLTQAQKDFLSSALRVNQTGELAAILIYAAQYPLITRAHPHLRPLMQHMYDQEAGHYTYFNSIIAKHRIRPTAMTPVWTAAASFLGWSTAFLGREAAMACTEAVETEIGTHYNEQVRVLLDWAAKCEARGESLGAELEEMIVQLRKIRDEELEHLDHAVENDAKEARPYEALTEIIRGGCRGAIWVSERV